MKHKIQVVYLPTEDKAFLFLNKFDTLKRYDGSEGIKNGGTHEPPYYNNQHLYATVSQDVEKPKEGDWCYKADRKYKDNEDSVFIGKCYEELGDLWVNFKDSDGVYSCLVDRKKIYKIIATTDPKLVFVKQEMPSGKVLNSITELSQSFLKEYVANPDGEYEIEYEVYYKGREPEDYQFTDNEAVNDLFKRYRLKINQDNTVNITSVEETCKYIKRPGASCSLNNNCTYPNCKEKMYSFIETVRIANKAISDYLDDNEIIGRKFLLKDDWIKENL